MDREETQYAVRLVRGGEGSQSTQGGSQLSTSWSPEHVGVLAGEAGG